jgi:hypothetical protein
MSILEFVEARKEHDRTKRRSEKCVPSVSMEPGVDLLNAKYDEVVRIMRWFIERRRTRASVAFVGGEEELIQTAMLYLLRWTPKKHCSLATRVCHCVMWAQGKMCYEINRKFEAKHEQVMGRRDRCVVDSEFDRVDREDLDGHFWRRCARIVRNDRQFRILFRWWKDDEDQTVMAEEQNVRRQMISLLMKKAEEKLRDKKAELVELNELFLGVK